MATMRRTRLVDHRGRPIDTAALEDELARPSVGGVRSILTTHPASGVTPERLAELLRTAEQPGGAERYLELAEEMEERDLHYLGVIQTRKRQVAQIGVVIEPASDDAADVDDADLVRTFFDREAVEDELFDILDAIGKGFSVTEIVWDMSESQWMPARLEYRLPQWFDYDRDSGTVLSRRPDGGGDWMDLEPWKYIVHGSRAKSGLPIRGGLARIAAWAWLFKSLTVKDWVRFAEAYGMPIRLGKYHASASPDDKMVLWRAVSNIAADAAAIVPEDMAIEFVDDATVRGRSEIYRDLVEYIDRQLSIAVLGQTLTTQEGDSGSYALGQVHNMVRGDIERSDGIQLAATLRRDLAIPMVQLNNGPRDEYPIVRIERLDAMDRKVLAETLNTLVPLGLKVRAEEVRARLGLEAPEGDDEVLAAPAGSTSAPATDMARALARLSPGERRALAATVAGGAEDPVDLAVAQAVDDWRPLVEPMVEPILAAAGDVLASGGTLSTFRERLPDLFGAMDDAAIASLLHHLTFSAALSGRGIPDDDAAA